MISPIASDRSISAAESYLRAGFSVVPIETDGSKSPTIEWATLQSSRIEADRVGRMFRGSGVGIICGAISGGLTVLDNDAPELWDDFTAAVEAEAPGLIARLPQMLTPKTGHHLYFRCDGPTPGNQKLAQSPKVDDEGRPGRRVLFETRGEGGYVVAPGSPNECHSWNLPYSHISGPAIESTPMITTDERELLFRIARTFNEVFGEAKRQPQSTTAPRAHSGSEGLSVGDDYNERASWDEILAPHGWTQCGGRGAVLHWKRPGKTEPGTSATTGCVSQSGNELFCVFSSNAYPFEVPAGETCGTFTKFAAYAVLNHGGDFSIATRTLGAAGYGPAPRNQSGLSTTVDTATRIAEPSKPDKPLFAILSAAELDAGDYHVEEAIAGVMVERQPMVILGSQKTLKTSIAYDLAIALATGGKFLGRFQVSRARRVLFMSGESGLGTLQETGRRQCDAAGLTLAEVSNLFISGNIPQIADAIHLGELRRVLTENELEVLFVDPLYLALDAGGSEGSVFAMGAMLRGIAEICQSIGVTLILLHHLRKGNGMRKGPPELSDASWSGISEFARQWVIIDRSKPYQPGSGVHELTLSIGGSAGQSGFYGLTVDEGVGVGNRHWSVTIQDSQERIESERAEREAAERERRQRIVDEHVGKIRQAFNQFPEGETERKFREATGLNGPKFQEALQTLRQRGEVEACEVVKGKQTYQGIKKRDPWAHSGSLGQGGSREVARPGVPFTGDEEG